MHGRQDTWGDRALDFILFTVLDRAWLTGRWVRRHLPHHQPSR